ncbi:TIR domain-containing protein [Brucellaceae bacterium D45D]
MKVFISWSGELSQKIAITLRDWLPSVIQTVEPYVSSEDIDKGTRWTTDISSELSESSYGILCMTPDNLNAPWINFEAGALSKAVDSSRVSPFLFRIKRSELSGPVVQFQSTLNEKNDVYKLLVSINNSCIDGKLPDPRLEAVFDVWWPHLEKKLISIEKSLPSETKNTAPKTKDKSDIMEEMLNLIRRQSVVINDPTKLLPPDYISDLFEQAGISRNRRESFSHPAIREFINIVGEFSSSFNLDDPDTAQKTMIFLDKIRRPLNYIESRLSESDHRRRINQTSIFE